MNRTVFKNLLASFGHAHSTRKVTIVLQDGTEVTLEIRHIDPRDTVVGLLCQARSNIAYTDITSLAAAS